MATGVAVLVIGALLDGAVSLVFVVAGVVLLGAGAVLLGRLPKRRKD